MLHADVDVPVSRAPCVCSDSLLLLTFSTDSAETLSEAAVHRPRTCAAALRVVVISQAALFVSSALLLVVLRGACGGLGGLDVLAVLHDA